MRILSEVIDKLLAVIPKEEELRGPLTSYRNSAITASPEMMQHWWRETAMELEDYFCETVDGEVQPPKLEEGSWQQKVYNIWMDIDG